MIRVAVLSLSDGRKRVHDSLVEYIKECENKIVAALRKTGEVDVFVMDEVIYNAELARIESKKAASLDIDAVILNIPVFAFPNYSAIVSLFQQVPILAISPVNGKLPGMGGLQAAVNMIRQIGGKCEKIWGNIDNEDVLNSVMAFLRAAYAANRLKGEVFGLLGGRSIGMGSGAVNPDLWMRQFGIDVEHIDELEILRRADTISSKKVDSSFKWLCKNVGSIKYDNDKLTEDSLKWQIKCYYAIKELIEERKLDFIGVKCHYDLSENYCTQCLSAAFFNDPYDWEGPKEPFVYSCEADADGALTMQVMKLISQKPVLFFDFRHFDEKENLFVFCNCGAMATWYAQRSNDPAENLKFVNLFPLIPKYAGQGAHVEFIAAEGEMTFGRLSRVLDKYKFTVFRGKFKNMPPEKLVETCPVWPHGFVEVNADPYDLINSFDSNHVHAVSGDYIQEIMKFCEIKGIECEVL